MAHKKIKNKIKNCIVLFSVVFTFVLTFSFSVFADFNISVQDGPFTVNVRTALPFSIVVPALSSSKQGISYSEFDIPIFTQLYLVNNNSVNTNKLVHISFQINFNINGAFIFSQYPSGAQFEHNVITKSFLGEDISVSCSVISSTSTVKNLLYDIWFIPHGNGNVAGLYRSECGFSDKGTLTYNFVNSNISLVSSSPSFSVSGWKQYSLGVYSPDTNILQAMLVQLEDLNYQAGTSNEKLQQLISLTSSVNNMLSIINSQFGVQTNSINNKLDMESQEIQDTLKSLENALVKSLTTINNTLILINNGIGKLDSDMVAWFSRFFTTFIGWDPSSNPPVGSVNPGYLIDSMKQTWSKIIEKGLDKVAPDTGAFDSFRDEASGELGIIQNNELIKNIGNTDNIGTAFDEGSSFFSNWGTKVLMYNNLLQKVYDAIGPFSYVIVITMVVGLLTFFFRVGNTIVRRSSGGSSGGHSWVKSKK